MHELESHLKPLQRGQIISPWNDSCISPGEEWEPLLKRQLESAQIILLLISIDFINSDYCYDVELAKAIEKHKSGRVRVIPIILRDCDWKILPVGDMYLGDLQALPEDTLPIEEWNSRDKAFANIARGIRQAVQEIREVNQSRIDEMPSIDFGNQKTEKISEKSENDSISKKSLDYHTDIQNKRPEQSFTSVRSKPAALPLSTIDLAKHENFPDSIENTGELFTFEFESIFLDSLGHPASVQKNQTNYIFRKLRELTLDLVLIPEGTFLMGSSEKKSYPEERPVHLVKIPPFFIGKHPITKEQWRFVSELPKMRIDLHKYPSKKGGGKHPVTRVSWEDSNEFCDRLSEFLGEKYRLPTEAEWEYSCRAGSLTAYNFGDVITSNVANFDGRYPCHDDLKDIFRGRITSVGELKYANQFGLFDMHGNIWEWCQDSWHESYNDAPSNASAWEDNTSSLVKVIRGGSWLSEAVKCRSAYRQRGDMNHRSENTGFRIAKSIKKDKI